MRVDAVHQGRHGMKRSIGKAWLLCCAAGITSAAEPTTSPITSLPPIPTLVDPAVTPARHDVLPLASVPIESVPMPAKEVDQSGATLQEMQFLALTNHPALREASAKVGVAQGEALQAGLPPNPFLISSSPQWAGSQSQYNWIVGQDFVTAGKLPLSRAAAEREVLKTQVEFTRTRFDVLTTVRVRFYEAAAAQRRTEVLEQLVGVTLQSRDVGKKLLEAGETNRADAMLLDIEYDKASAVLQNNEATLAAARKQLAAVVGLPAIDIGALQFDFTTPLPEYEHEALRLGVVDRNALAQAAAVEIQRTQWALRRASVEPWPNVQLQAGYQYSVEGDNNDQGFGQVMMSVPLWNRNQGGIRAARAETVRAMAGLQRTETELSQQAAEALGRYAAASIRAEVYEKQILPKAREVFRVNRSLFEQGQTDFLRLLQSQRTLIESDLGYIDAQEARWTAAAEISGLLQLEQFP